MLDPMNVDETVELLGVPGYQSAVADQRQKTLQDIDKLLQGQPLPGKPGPNGQPGPPQPSVPPDLFDDAALVTQLMAKWLVGPVGQKQAGTPGFFNVDYELVTPNGISATVGASGYPTTGVCPAGTTNNGS